MKKTLATIRSKPPHVRMTIAVVLAATLTLIIGAGWLMTFSTIKQRPATSKAPSPFTALTGTIKNVVENPKQDRSSVQIIDAGNQDATYDESNPYQNPTTPEATQGKQ